MTTDSKSLKTVNPLPAYDFLVDGFEEDIEFYSGLAEKSRGPVLELACGVGRISFPIAQRGIPVVSMESASWMLEDAVKESRERDLPVHLLQGDYRKFSFNTRFPLIIFPFNSFSLLHTISDIEECLRNVRRHLNPDGLFAFDIFHPNLEWLARNPFERFVIARFPSPVKEAEVVVTETIDYDRVAQLNHNTWTFSFGKRSRDETQRNINRMFFPQEIDMILHYNGFAIDHKYGDFRTSPFVGDSFRQVFICSLL